MAPTRKTCSTCGTPLDENGSGECASCLFQIALDVGTADRTHSRAFTPPDPKRLASLLPDFELQEILGRGGMGVVYRVRQTRLNRQAALKVLPPERASDPEFVERFFREAQALAQLSHPNIVNVYDMGQRGPYLYILMEYIEGQSLRTRIGQGMIAPADAIRIAMDLCGAVQFAHVHGIVHRDIKPENVLITSNNRVKLVDFGLVKLASRHDVDPFTLTEINLRMGTPSYMAPEQTAGKADLDHRVDIYALGVLLYETLTGGLPVLDYTPPSKKVRVDARIDRVIHRAIRESPSERYQSAADLHRDVEHILRTPRRRRIVAGALVLLGLAGLCGGLLWHRAATADPAPPPGTPIDGVPIAVVPFDADEAREHQERWAEHLGVPLRWTNSIGMDFVLIPPGEYQRGIPERWLPDDIRHPEQHDTDPTRLAAFRGSMPIHRVRLTRAIYLATTEVTQGQYTHVTVDKVGYFRSGMPGEYRLDGPDTKRLPAENLGWTMAVGFCKRLSELEGLNDPALRYRLPTDAEWAFAVRAGTDTRFWYGVEPDVEGIYEVSSTNTASRPLPVGSRRPNPFGLYDMSGNVAEFCSDWWTPDEFKPYRDRCALDPSGPEDGMPGGLRRVVRGGHFGIQPAASTRRVAHAPHQWINTIGFRVAIPAAAVANKRRPRPTDTSTIRGPALREPGT